MDTFDRKIHLRNKTSHDNEIIKNTLRQEFGEKLIEGNKNSIPIESILGPGSPEKYTQVTKLVIEKFRERGISDALLSPVFFKKEKVFDMQSRGQSSPFMVEIFDTDIENLQLKQLVTFKTLVHELYHSAGRYSFVFSEDQGAVLMYNEASGASFMKKDAATEHLMLFEEGAATQFEDEVFGDIKELFPHETIQLYEKTIGEIRAIHHEKGLSDHGINIVKLTDSGEWRYADSPQYSDAVEIHRCLAEKIPNFINLLEQARVYGKIFPLARAVEATFGPGWYRKLATANVEDAKALLVEME
jgi:hypothetical protein